MERYGKLQSSSPWYYAEDKRSIKLGLEYAFSHHVHQERDVEHQNADAEDTQNRTCTMIPNAENSLTDPLELTYRSVLFNTSISSHPTSVAHSDPW